LFTFQSVQQQLKKLLHLQLMLLQQMVRLQHLLMLRRRMLKH
jgi:hypothetical protein